MRRVTTRDARFQEWLALLGNRNKRHRCGEFVIQGVRPITMAVRHGWTISALLHDDGNHGMSAWARDILASTPAAAVAMPADLLRELAGKDEDSVEVVAVARMPPDDLGRISLGDGFLGIAFDRPTSPGNVGTVVRSADAFGASGVIVTGHAADPYDPKAVRASTGSLFAVPVVRAPSPREVLAWLPPAVRVIGTDEHGEVDLSDADLRGPLLLAVGNETRGLSEAWRASCHQVVRIPIGGSASSLNAAAAATICLYEARRQRSRR